MEPNYKYYEWSDCVISETAPSYALELWYEVAYRLYKHDGEEAWVRKEENQEELMIPVAKTIVNEWTVVIK